MPARSSVALVLLACVSVCMAAEPAPPNERLDRLRAALRRPLAALVEAAGKHADAQNGLLGRLRDPELKQISRAYASARDAFRAAVAANWPYPLERPALPAAAKALAAARAFEQDLYRNGRATSQEAAQRYLAVANEFPNSRERRAALGAAYRLCTPHSPVDAGEIATGIDTSNLEVTTNGPVANSNGQEFAPTLGTPELAELLSDGTAHDVFRITMTYTSDDLNSAADGTYAITVVHGHDVAGNVPGDDRDADPPEWTVGIQ